MSLTDIAKRLGDGRTKSSVSREVAGKPRKGVGKYQAYVSREEALERRYGKKQFRLKSEFIRAYVKEKMKLWWSPEQVSLRLPIDHQA